MNSLYEIHLRDATLSAVKKSLKASKPTTGDELLKTGFTTRFISYGAFRNVYELVGTPYAVKLPLSQNKHYIDHGRLEYTVQTKMVKSAKYRSIREYLPAFHFFDDDTGLLLADRYTQVDDWDKKFDPQIHSISMWLANRGYSEPDLGVDKRENYGVDSKGKLKILDLGCFTEGVL